MLNDRTRLYIIAGAKLLLGGISPRIIYAMTLQSLLTSGSTADWLDETTRRLAIPPTPVDRRLTPYVVAQLDDYHGLSRHAFPWQPPCTLELRARISADGLPGTWGFGLWNDPFSFSLGMGGASRRFPALPNAAWFFYASPPNYLSFRDDLPAQGFLAATFRSPVIPSALLALASPGLMFGAFPPTARLLRFLLCRFVRQDACLVPTHPLTDWHHYRLEWQPDNVSFSVDEQEIFTTRVAPRGPLALVLWIDNQYAAFPPNGRIAFGNLPLPDPAYLDLAEVRVANGEWQVANSNVFKAAHLQPANLPTFPLPPFKCRFFVATAYPHPLTPSPDTGEGERTENLGDWGGFTTPITQIFGFSPLLSPSLPCF